MKTDTLSEIVYKELKQRILSGEYQPGERLLIEKISNKLEVSMTPLKDAFRLLEQEGLVTNIPRKGTFVTKLSDQDVLEYCMIRLSLESLGVDTICSRDVAPLPGQIKDLEDLNKKVELALKKQNKKDFIIYDIKFHKEIAALSGNNKLVEMLSMYPLNNFLVLMGGGILNTQDITETVSQHSKIIDALQKKDAVAAKQLLKENILILHQNLIRANEEI
ncbi:MAG: GntR family transcriptional regulator [Sphaerochaetaceae bacterium]|nr:GntR family transcriptional regulator [Sphaerochaetaceae bacterium]